MSSNIDASSQSKGLASKLSNWKTSLDLAYPGSFENLHKEARNVLNGNYFFEGGKADLAKGLSPNFQVSHSFFLGGGSGAPQSYHFGALYADEHHVMHGLINPEGNLQGKMHWMPNKEITVKVQQQIIPKQAAYDMVQFEIERAGSHGNVAVKAMNPSPFGGLTGIYSVAMLQSVTNKTALGVEAVWQRMGPKMRDFGLVFGVRWATTPNDAPVTSQSTNAQSAPRNNRVFCLSIQQLSVIQASYYHRVTDKLELSTELQANLVGSRKDAVATVACKLDFKQSTLRAQADTLGRVALVLEEKLAPGFSLFLCGEMDHLKNNSRFGVGINMES